MKRKSLFILLLFMTLVLSGCKSENSNEQSNSTTALIEYEKDGSKDFILENVNFNSSFCVKENCLDCVLSNTEGGFEEKELYFDGTESKAVFSNANEEYLYSSFQNDGSLLVLSFAERKYLISTYSSDGEKTGSLSLPFETCGDDFPFFVCKIEGGQYILMTHSSLFMINALGEVVKESSLENETISGAIQLSDGSVCVTYGQSIQANLIAIIDDENMEFLNKARLEFYPSLLCEKDSKCLVSDGNYLYVYEPLKRSIEKYCDIGKHYLKNENIRSVFFDDNKMYVVYNDSIYTPGIVKVIEFTELGNSSFEEAKESENVKFDKEGRRIIYIYSPNDERYLRTGFGEAINEFNLDNTDYCVEIIKEEAKFDVAVDSNMSPDIYISMRSESFDNYAQKGFFEDLLPYIDNSDSFKREDFTDLVKVLYETDGHLYGITNKFSLKSIRVTDCDDEFDGAWTVEEYLGWLSANSDIRTSAGLTKSSAIYNCLPGIVSDFVDLEAGKSDFDSERFVNILNMTANLSFEPESGDMIDIFFDKDRISEAREHPYYSNSTIGSVSQMAKENFLLGKRLELIGYPSNSETAQGILTALYNVALVSKSECKEGAYEFIEYWLEREERLFDLSKNNPKMSYYDYFSSLKSIYEEALNSMIGQKISIDGTVADEAAVYEITEDNIDRVKEMLSNARHETYEQIQIKEIVGEELGAFFSGEKDAESTARIIQNRVQLFLNERR